MEKRSAPRSLVATIISVGVGLVTWVSITYVTGIEAWDHHSYWWFAYPVMLVTAWFLGSWVGSKAWLWGTLMMTSQFIWLFFKNYNQATIPLLTLGVFFVLSLPLILASHISASRTPSHNNQNK